MVAGEAEISLRKLSNNVAILHQEQFNESELEVNYFLECISSILFNDIIPEDSDVNALHGIKVKINDILGKINDKLNLEMNTVIHDEDFKALEANWRGLYDLISNTDWSADIMIDILDVSKQELADDFESNSVDLTSSAFFKKAYVAEYDQYGGRPYGGIIGLYEFKNNERDRQWLDIMSKIAAACHSPFISSVGPKFFGCKNIQEMAEIKDIEGHMSQPRYNKWNKFRDAEEAAYIGMALPHYLLRAPYDPDCNPAGDLRFMEIVNKDNGHDDFLWGNSAILFARNMVRSFADSGWCQYIRGPKGGGLIEYLSSFSFKINGHEEMKIPVELTIPDHRELQFANTGFIPLIYRKGSSDACFFSCQSIKKPKHFKDPQDSENSQLVTNLSYTLSITRIAHYIKCIMRDNIGTPADAAYINNIIQNWLSQYVTTVMNPDDHTLRFYPFKAAQTETVEQEGMIGWYKCTVKVLPHIQFEGLDVELQLDVRL
ncbi:MAG: type VI secretion system contractile sheath large subunit [candidate division Zixibacteria bacterium]|nr:type VI secretion system contractile sheath large subunit [candidate division Zixibacteria bacterium]